MVRAEVKRSAAPSPSAGDLAHSSHRACVKEEAGAPTDHQRRCRKRQEARLRDISGLREELLGAIDAKIDGFRWSTRSQDTEMTLHLPSVTQLAALEARAAAVEKKIVAQTLFTVRKDTGIAGVSMELDATSAYVT